MPERIMGAARCWVSLVPVGGIATRQDCAKSPAHAQVAYRVTVAVGGDFGPTASMGVCEHCARRIRESVMAGA